MEQLSADSTADEYRSHFEKLIIKGGVDITTGGELWNQYRQFELDEYEDVVDAAEEEGGGDPEDVQEAKVRVIRLFHRQLSLPLVGNQKVLKEFEDWLASHCVESDVELINPSALEKKCTAAAAALEARLPFEMHLISDAYDADTTEGKASSWLAYIRFEIAEQDMSRARRLFERALGLVPGGASRDLTESQADAPCREVPALWSEYVSFARSVVKDWQLVEAATALCRPLFPSDLGFWKTRLAALEICGQSADALKKELAFIAASCSFADVQAYMYVHQFGCDFFKRRLSSLLTARGYPDEVSLGAADAEQVLAGVRDFRECCQRYEDFVLTYYPEWEEGWLQVTRYQVAVEDLFLEEVLSSHLPEASAAADLHPLDSSELFNALLRRFPKSYYVYTEYIHWSIYIAHNADITRRLYRRSLSAVTDFVEELARQWECWERQCATSTLQQVMEMDSKVEAALTALKSKRAQAEARAEKAGAGVGSRREDRDTALPKEPRKRAGAAAAANGQEQPSHKRVRVEEKQGDLQEAVAAEGDECLNKHAVQIGNLPFCASAKEVYEFVAASVGTNADASSAPAFTEGQFMLVLSKAGKSRGLVVVSGLSVASKQLIVSQLPGALFEGRPLSVAEHDAGVDAGGDPGSAKTLSHDPTTVYVTRVPLEAGDSDLEAAFASVGEVFAARILRDKVSKSSKGAGLVQFVSRKSRDNVLKKGCPVVTICGAPVLVLPSKFPCVVPEAPGRASSPYGPSSSGAAAETPLVASNDGGNGPPKAKSVAFLKPRVVRAAASTATAPPRSAKRTGLMDLTERSPGCSAEASDVAPLKSNADFRKFL